MAVKIFKRKLDIENVSGEMLRYLNFSGRDTNGFNPNHHMSFDIEFNEDDARALYDLGWRIKVKGLIPGTQERARNARFDDELDNKTYHATVNVSFDYPCYVYRIIEGTNTMVRLRPDSPNPLRNIAVLDSDSIVKADLTIRGSYTKKDGLISLYLEDGKFHVSSGRLQDKYAGFVVDDDEPDLVDQEYDGDAPWENK